MELKEGDVITFRGKEKREVLGVCGKIVFLRDVLEVGVGSPFFIEIEDLVTFGWEKVLQA